MATTGALWVFQEELNPIFYPELFQVNPSGDTVSLERMQADIQSAYPEFQMRNINMRYGNDISWSSSMQREGPDGELVFHTVYYDQYRGRILGALAYDEGFFGVILKIHRTLYAGVPGRVATETATCWGIVSVLAGLYLWWPRQKEKVWGVWLPRITGRFKTILRDWHTVPGMYFAVFAVAIMFTGLLFTQFWGRAWFIGHSLTGAMPQAFLSPPKSVIEEGQEAPAQASLDKVFHSVTALATEPATLHSLSIPKHGTDETFRYFNNIMDPFGEKIIAIVDQYSGEVLLAETDEDLSLGAKLTFLFYPIHTGTIFGFPTKVLAFISCLLIIAMSATGVWMWWRRRPSGKFGAPGKPPPKTVPRWIAWVTIALAVFLPMVGLTLILIALVSWVGHKFRKSRPA